MPFLPDAGAARPCFPWRLLLFMVLLAPLKKPIPHRDGLARQGKLALSRPLPRAAVLVRSWRKRFRMRWRWRRRRDRAVRRFGRTRMVWGFGRTVGLRLVAIIGITTGDDGAVNRQQNLVRAGRSGRGRRLGDSSRLVGLEFGGGSGGKGRHLRNGFGDGVDHGTGAGGPGLQSGLDHADGGSIESRVLACLTNAAALAGNSAAAILPRTTPYGLTP